MFGRVPMLDDGNVVLFESRAIARYFALKHRELGPDLLPNDLNAEIRAAFEMWLIVEVEEFSGNAAPVIAETIVAPWVNPSLIYSSIQLILLSGRSVDQLMRQFWRGIDQDW